MTPFSSLTALVEPPSVPGLVWALLVYGAFLLSLALGARLLPAAQRAGMAAGDGSRLSYRLNGMLLFLLAVASALTAIFVFHLQLSMLLRHFWDLFVVINAFAFVVTAALVVVGRRREPENERDSRLPAWLHDAWCGATSSTCPSSTAWSVGFWWTQAYTVRRSERCVWARLYPTSWDSSSISASPSARASTRHGLTRCRFRIVPFIY